MAGEIIRPSALPPRASPVATEIVPSDNGSTVGGVTWAAGVAAGRPLASQAEAEAGTDATKAMTPLTAKQQLHALGDVRFASAAQGGRADSAVQPGDLAAVATSGDYDDLINKPPGSDTNRKTVALLLADTVFSYISGAGKSLVAAGDILTAQGYRYEVAASGAIDSHIATAGGVKLYVQPGMGGKHYAEAWGVVADDGNSYSTRIQEMINSQSGAMTIVLPAGTTKGTGTIYLKRSRVGIEGAGPGGQSFYMLENAGGIRAFCGDTDESTSMNTYTGNFLRDFEVLSTGVETNDASIVVDLTSFSYGTFDIRAQTKRANGIIYYGQGNNGASPYYNKITATGLFGWTDQTQTAFVFEHGLWSGGSPGPNSNFIGPITEAPLFWRFADIRAGQANHFTMLGIESIKDAYFVLGGRAAVDPGGFSSGSNTYLTLNDTTKSWSDNEFSGCTVRTVGGTGAGQIRKVANNTATQLVVQDPWAAIPGTDTTYEIYRPLAISNHFSHIRGEDTNAENPDFVRALYDSDDFTFDSWYVDSIGTGSLFADYTGSVNNKVLGSKTVLTYTFKNPGTSVVVDAWERNSFDGGMPMPGKYSVDFVRITKSLGNSGGSIFCQLDCGGGAAGSGSPTFFIDSPIGNAGGMDMPGPTQKGPIIGTNNPLFLTLTTGSDVAASEDFTVSIGLSLFD